MRKLLKILTGRMFITILLIALQGILLFSLVGYLAGLSHVINGAMTALSIIVALWLFSKYENPSYKMVWLIIILVLPVFGVLLYLFFGNKAAGQSVVSTMRSKTYKGTLLHVEKDPAVLSELEGESRTAARQAQFILNGSGMALFKNTETEFLCPGEVYFERLVSELKKAEKYIFMEYFIIEEGKMWNTILDVLYEKAQGGVDVRVMYDGLGCVNTLPGNYNKYLESIGIKCQVFNPLVPVLSIKHNNRDHRKICVIDGKVGFTGGVNLADEYINEKQRFGHWLDCGIMLKGQVIEDLLVTFLATWDFLRNLDEKDEHFSAEKQEISAPGYTVAYSDDPFFGRGIAANVYLNMISKAKNYLYINTPYLIIDFAMEQALCTAARSGVDVRVCFPGIPDKKLAYLLGRSYFKTLTKAGVKIYIYEKGFVHSKTFVADDTTAVVGTINMDYRSLYLHFENAVWMYKTAAVMQVKSDFLLRQEGCRLVTMEEIEAVKWYEKLAMTVLAPFAPLL